MLRMFRVNRSCLPGRSGTSAGLTRRPPWRQTPGLAMQSPGPRARKNSGVFTIPCYVEALCTTGRGAGNVMIERPCQAECSASDWPVSSTSSLEANSDRIPGHGLALARPRSDM